MCFCPRMCFLHTNQISQWNCSIRLHWWIIFPCSNENGWRKVPLWRHLLQANIILFAHCTCWIDFDCRIHHYFSKHYRLYCRHRQILEKATTRAPKTSLSAYCKRARRAVVFFWQSKWLWDLPRIFLWLISNDRPISSVASRMRAELFRQDQREGKRRECIARAAQPHDICCWCRANAWAALLLPFSLFLAQRDPFSFFRVALFSFCGG